MGDWSLGVGYWVLGTGLVYLILSLFLAVLKMNEINRIMKNILLVVLLLSSTLLTAQDVVSIGFKTGLTFSTFDGPLETNANGDELESQSYTTGFNVGALVNFRLTDFFGVRTELLYIQKGTEFNYDGNSYFIFDPSGQRIVTTGEREMILEVTNSYIEIPLMGYAKFGPIEFQGGAYVSALVNATASGNLKYRPSNAQVSSASEIEFNLDYNYYRDEPGEFLGELKLDNVIINGNRIDVPETLAAYYEQQQEDGNLYNTIDYGLIGGVAFYLNGGLFINLRAEYGLADITNEERDVSLNTLDSGNFIFRDDLDRNLSLQASIGFRF